MNERLIIFDCDGVLVDSEILANHVLAQVFRECGFDISPADCVRRFVGMSLRSVREAVEADFGRRLPEGFETRTRALSDSALDRELRPVPGVADLLADLAPPRCVASSSSLRRIQRSLGTAGLDAYFDASVLFSASMVARGKPAPDLFLHAAAAMGHPPEDCLVIEDSLPGVTAGVAAGMTVLGFAGASHIAGGHAERLTDLGAAAVFDDMAELPRLIAAF